MIWICLFSTGFSMSTMHELFEEERYTDAAALLKMRLTEAPDDPDANFWMGRCLLASDQPEKAIGYFKKAELTMAGTADYHFWLGVNHWAMLDFDNEMVEYETAIKLDPHHLPSHVYLGHGLMDRGQWEAAAEHYRIVLNEAPGHAEALFNVGLAYRRQEQREAENAAWHRYLKHFNWGTMAFRAVDYLNRNGDFSYRVSRIGSKKLIFKTNPFETDAVVPSDSFTENMAVIVRELAANPALTLHIVVYAAGREPTAMARAMAVKKELIDLMPTSSRHRVAVSWFGIPERISIDGMEKPLNESAHLFTTSATLPSNESEGK
jgi:tetratricopeptide (TPR) repeat protein